jgi:hypothetical protein
MMRGLLAGVIGMLVSGPALAHHSFAMFDLGKTVTIQGTVVSFEMINPHSWLYVETKDSAGKTAEWALEMGGTGAMTRAGWQKDTVKAGDPIAVDIHPLKDGTHGGQFLRARLSGGKAIEGGDTGLGPGARE